MTEPINGATPQTAPKGPAPTKPKTKASNNLNTKGRKPRHRSTKVELNREKMTAKVITCLVTGKTIEETAHELDLTEAWVRRVRDELPEDLIAQLTQAKSSQISDLIEQGLRMQLESMNNLLEVTRNEVWVNNQRAPEIATLFGVINDKTVRVLAAIERANERDRFEREEAERGAGNAPEPVVRREPHVATQGA